MSVLACIENSSQNTMMDRAVFHKSYDMLRAIDGLLSTRHMVVQELVTIFLHILVHHVKNRMIRRQFVGSNKPISVHFSNVLLGNKCHKELF